MRPTPLRLRLSLAALSLGALPLVAAVVLAAPADAKGHHRASAHHAGSGGQGRASRGANGDGLGDPGMTGLTGSKADSFQVSARATRTPKTQRAAGYSDPDLKPRHKKDALAY